MTDDHDNSTKTRGVPFFVPILNPVIKSMVRMGIPVGPMALLTVRGRKTGKRRTTPVGLLGYDGHQYVFGTFGEVDWVRNLRTAGEATITRGRRRRSVVAVELPTREAASVLRNVLGPFFKSRIMSQFLRMGYDLKHDSTMEAFLEEARRHPGFELLEGPSERGSASSTISLGRSNEKMRINGAISAEISRVPLVIPEGDRRDPSGRGSLGWKSVGRGVP
jgi:deazaflavin-dependent oxidoreductase (nitroreductase family)